MGAIVIQKFAIHPPVTVETGESILFGVRGDGTMDLWRDGKFQHRYRSSVEHSAYELDTEGDSHVIKVSGVSDDLIKVEGDVTEEFSFAEYTDDGDLLAFSNGTVLRINYTESGVWRITPVVHGPGRFVLTQCPENDDTSYTDTAEIHADITWVVHGIAVAGPPGARTR